MESDRAGVLGTDPGKQTMRASSPGMIFDGQHQRTAKTPAPRLWGQNNGVFHCVSIADAATKLRVGGEALNATSSATKKA